jgi:integrase
LRFDTKGQWHLSTPKTPKSRRRIELPPMTIEAMLRHRVCQLEERQALGAAWMDHHFVFTRKDGEPLRGTHVLEREFRPLLQAAGLPPIRLHDLRHTAATLLLLQNVPVKVVSEMLGHSSVAITLDRYSHVLPSMQRDAAAAMERLLAPHNPM